MPSSSILPTLLSEYPWWTLTTDSSLTLDRVSPVLKKAIESGEINLTAIVNTHQ